MSVGLARAWAALQLLALASDHVTLAVDEPEPATDLVAAGRVLLIEDDAALVTVDGELLEGPGDAVQVGGSGEGALTALTARAFDPMLADVFVRAG